MCPASARERPRAEPQAQALNQGGYRFVPPTLLVLVSGLVLIACTQRPLPFPPIPAPQAEEVPAPPVWYTPLIWQPGHYDWDGSHYVWSKGEWTDKAGKGTLWQDGYWEQQGDNYVWVRGHWL